MDFLPMNTPIRIRKISDPEEWSKTLPDFKSSIFITDKWLHGIKKDHAQPIFLDFISDHETVGKIAGLSCRSLKYNFRILYFYSGIAFRTADAGLVAKANRQLIQYAKINKYDKLILESVDYHEDFNIPVKGLAISRSRLEFILDLNPGEDLLYSRFNKTIRKHVRRAEKKGSVVKESKSPEMLKRLIKYLEVTREIRISKGYGIYNYLPMNYLDEKALKIYLENGLATMFYVTTGDEINCILYVLLHGKKAFFFLIGTTEGGYESYSPVYVYYNTMKILMSRGFTTFNLGGIPEEPSSQPGLIFLKTSMGAHPVKLMNHKTYYLTFPLKALNPFMMWFDSLPNNKLTRRIRQFVWQHMR